MAVKYRRRVKPDIKCSMHTTVLSLGHPSVTGMQYQPHEAVKLKLSFGVFARGIPASHDASAS
jgi:hypothetical protein